MAARPGAARLARQASRPTQASCSHQAWVWTYDTVAAFRAAQPAERREGCSRLYSLLSAHLDLAQRYLYPLVIRTEPDGGTEIAWYPEVHEREALRLLDRLDCASGHLDARASDELAADVRRYILEIELRVLPLLTDRLDDEEQRRLAALAALADIGLPVDPSQPPRLRERLIAIRPN